MPGITLSTRDVRESVSRQSHPLETTDSLVQEADRPERNLRKREAAERHHITNVSPTNPTGHVQRKSHLDTLS